MSRGPGKVMRAALETVLASDKTLAAADIAIAVYGLGPAENGVTYVTHAQHVSVRRALVALVRLGEVRDMGLYRGNWRRYASPAVATRLQERERTAFGRVHRGVRPIPPARPAPPSRL